MSDLRSELRSNRKALSVEERRDKSLAILTHLSRYLPFVKTASLAIYSSTSEEVDTSALLDYLVDTSKDIYLPVVNQSRIRAASMLFARYLPGKTRVRKNRFGIIEPECPIGECVQATDLPFLVVPMVGFNRQCDRIGMGGGYYDRALAGGVIRQPHLVGLAFACQEAKFDANAHDVPMDAVVTEEGILLRSKSEPRQH